jgi:hypothetical protein
MPPRPVLDGRELFRRRIRVEEGEISLEWLANHFIPRDFLPTRQQVQPSLATGRLEFT